jgi:hypothetical protein
MTRPIGVPSHSLDHHVGSVSPSQSVYLGRARRGTRIHAVVAPMPPAAVHPLGSGQCCFSSMFAVGEIRRSDLGTSVAKKTGLRPMGTVCNSRNLRPFRLTSRLPHSGHTNSSGLTSRKKRIQPSPYCGPPILVVFANSKCMIEQTLIHASCYHHPPSDPNFPEEPKNDPVCSPPDHRPTQCRPSLPALGTGAKLWPLFGPPRLPLSRPYFPAPERNRFWTKGKREVMLPGVVKQNGHWAV